MAITIQKQPQRLQTTYNPLIIVATSSRQAEDGFLMVGDVYANGTYVTRMKVATNPDGYCIFDVHKHIENRISYDFNPIQNGWAPATYSQATYSVLLGEEWRPKWTFFDNFFLPGSKLGFIGLANDNPQPQFSVGDSILVEQTTPFTFSQYNGQATIVGIYATSGLPSPYNGNRWIIEIDKNFLGNTPPNGGTISLFGFRTYIGTNVANVGNTSSALNQKRAFNGVNDFLDDITWNYLEYTCGTYSGGTGKFLTNAPDGWKLGTQSRMWLHVYQDDANDAANLIINTNKGTFSMANTFLTPLNTNYQAVLEVGCGPYQLISNTASISIVSGSFPIIDNDTKELFLSVRNSGGTQVIETKRFTIDNLCSRYEKVQLVFMDKLGSMVPFIFNYASRETKQIARANYQQHYGQYAPSSQNWTYNTFDRGKKSLDTVVNEVWTVTSDWINQSQSDYLMTLMESPEVYWIKEDGTAIAVSLTVAGTERKQTINDQIINYTITFELSSKSYKQRG
jgi:hypothetical protein